MTKNDVCRGLKSFLLSFEHNSGLADIPGDLNLFEQGIVTSLAFVELVQFIEKTFKIILDDDVIFSDHFNSLDSISGYISRKLERPKACV